MNLLSKRAKYSAPQWLFQSESVLYAEKSLSFGRRVFDSWIYRFCTDVRCSFLTTDGSTSNLCHVL